MSEVKREDDETLFDMLNLTPPPIPPGLNVSRPSMMNEYGNSGIPTDSLVLNGPNSNMATDQNFQDLQAQFAHSVNVNLSSNGIGYSNSLMPQTNGNLLAPHQGGSYLNPRSPDTYSQHSLYSEGPLNPGSPFQDAASHFSDVGSHFSDAFSNVNVNTSRQNQQFGQVYLEPASQTGTFGEEILLGESISSTDLNNMGYHNFNEPLQQNLENQYMGQPVIQEPIPEVTYTQVPSYQNLNRLTEKNLLNYTETIQNFAEPDERKEVTIAIHQAPDVVAARTPSLFSNSSHNSSVNNSPNKPSGNQLQLNQGTYSSNNSPLLLNQQMAPPSPGSVYSDDANSLLRPEEFQHVRRGRRKAHSIKSHSQALRSRLRSGLNASGYEYSSDDYEEDDDEENGNVVSSREKMLELALSNQPSRRTQKHPSLYACHLCEKRFTRPYNLKSHLRTHTDERPFICNVCGKAFARQHDRKRHEDLHSGEKKFQCKGFLKDGTPYGCGRKFARADALRRHFQTESGKECIRVLIEEDERETKAGNAPSSGIQLPGGDFLSPSSITNLFQIPLVAISPPE